MLLGIKDISKPKVQVRMMAWKMMYPPQATAQVYSQKLLGGNTALRKEASLSLCGFRNEVTLGHG